jgi:hypothetical protein
LAEHEQSPYVRHNVASTKGLFASVLANTGETVTVEGTEKLEAGT